MLFGRPSTLVNLDAGPTLLSFFLFMPYSTSVAVSLYSLGVSAFSELVVEFYDRVIHTLFYTRVQQRRDFSLYRIFFYYTIFFTKGVKISNISRR